MNDSCPKAAAVGPSLPYIDRRSLSQAWYSALHLASDGPAPAGALDRRAAYDAPLPRRPPSARAEPALGAQASGLARRSAVPPPQRARVGGAASARTNRAAHFPSAARAIRGARSYPPFRTSLTIGLDKQRVQLLLRRDGATLHVVALCSPRVADVVRRALACADAHLRGRGEAVRSSVHVVGPAATPA